MPLYVLYRVTLFFSLPLFLLACNFDTSAVAPVGDPTNSDTGFGDCVDFESEPCEDCGATVCINGLAGPEILCQPDANSTVCGELACNNEGICEAQIPCSDGFSRKCGDCGTESCVGGAWTGECVPDDNACEGPTVCLAGAGQRPSCQAACRTEGFQTPYIEGPGLNTGDAGVFGGVSIPDIVPLGSQWKAIDGCDEENGDYRQCTCGLSYYPGIPEVDCEAFCRY